MTRAVQTAMVCLQGHYASESSGIECMSAAREIKGLGGMDCIGKVVGDEIVTRALDEMEKINGPEFAAQYTSELGVGHCSEQWWTNVKDTKSSLEDRCELFWSTLEANPASSKHCARVRCGVAWCGTCTRGGRAACQVRWCVGTRANVRTRTNSWRGV